MGKESDAGWAAEEFAQVDRQRLGDMPVRAVRFRRLENQMEVVRHPPATL